jgi:regulator of sigma E protease
MNTSLLGGITFVAVFAGIILLHELGHFFAARLLGIEVEEFGIGFPPRLLRFFRSKGKLVLAGRNVEIPRNFTFPFDQKTILHRPVTAIVDEVKGKLVLRKMEVAATEEAQSQPDPVVGLTVQTQPGSFLSQAPASIKESPHGTLSITGELTELRPGTDFTLNWIPLGGFNKIKGEDDPNTPGGMAAAKPWKRIIVLVAGVTMNLLTAVLVYTILFSQVGIPDNRGAVVDMVEAGSPAEKAGLKANDIVLSVAGTSITNYNQLISITRNFLGKPLPLIVMRNGQTLNITVTPRTIYPANQGPMGIAVGQPLHQPGNWFETIPFSFSAAGSDIQNILALPGRIIAGTVSSQEAQLGGPRTIWNLFQQSVARDVSSRQPGSHGQVQVPTNYTLLIIISLTITVGVANLLPIPALDGWRIFTTLVEVIIRRPIPVKFQLAINSIGFLVLIILLGMFYVKDLINPINFTLP